MWQAPFRKPTKAVNRGPMSPRPHQLFRQRAVMDPLALLAPLGDAAMLLDDHGYNAELDLLQTLWRFVDVLQSAVATRAVVETVLPGIVEFVLGKRGALVARVAWLPASLSFAAFPFGLFFRRLDDIRGRRLRGGRGVLLSCGQFPFEVGDARFEFRRAAIQPLAVRTLAFLGSCHGGKTLTHCRKITKISSKPVNAYVKAKASKKGSKRGRTSK